MFKEIEKNDELAISLIKKINKSAYDFYENALKENCFIFNYLLESDSGMGVFSAIEKDDFVLIHLAFKKNSPEENLFLEIKKIVLDIIEKYSHKKSIFMNVNNNNVNLIHELRKIGFKEDSAAVQYYINLSNDNTNFNLPDTINVKRFQEEDFNSYIYLLDRAFRTLDISLGNDPHQLSKNKKKAYKWLKNKDSNDELRVFYDKDELIGLYILQNEYIHTIAVNPLKNRKGYGGIILKSCLKHFFNKGYDKVYLNCLDLNEKAHNFYLKYGFIESSRYSENTYIIKNQGGRSSIPK